MKIETHHITLPNWQPATYIKQRYSVVNTYREMPEATVTQEMVDTANDKIGTKTKFGRMYSPIELVDSEWSHFQAQFYRERLVYVRDVEVLMVRFCYNYEVDLDRINNERDLLAWALHFTEKTWMNTERLHYFIEATASIKHLRIYGV
jgi:hypothetical protein